MREFWADFWWGFTHPGLALRGWHREDQERLQWPA